MSVKRLLVGVVVVALCALAAGGVVAQTVVAGGADPAFEARAQELAAITADRAKVVRGIIDQWRSSLRPANPALNDDGGVGALTAALSLATSETLLAASRAQSYEEVVALFADRKQEPSVIALEPGQPIPHTLGSSTGDLVFTPITPCRIFDSRIAAGTWRTKVGPNSGNWFSVARADFTAQGGAASCPGLPTSFTPAAVALNLTSTGQTGVGNLRLVECGATLPTVSLLNYAPGVNLANAAIIRSVSCPLGPPAGVGPNDIAVYSTNAASDVVVDIMGYYAAPVATAVDCTTVSASNNSIAPSSTSGILTPTCPAGYRLTGGGAYTNLLSSSTNGFEWYNSSPQGNAWQCWGQNFTPATLIGTCFAVCCRVPGR